ncbi:CopG family transcriptional regulator [Corynebacterium nuruki]|uniref:CopG family transcriptional regulator n=1 Tax=Corynebacterium nuruki TaxID=1032851 RepID=A0A3D4SZB3_9CORY|nr:CopG family transcriptional regulator [Corynebacterium nuruki]HCT14618.1 CopG family transcriptional regulator [Corynebacterium nuruki]
MRKNETREEAEARYGAWADAAERGEFDPTGDYWVNPEHPDYRPGRPKAGDKRPTTMVSLRLNVDDGSRLDRFLTESGRSRSDVLREALDEYLTQRGA